MVLGDWHACSFYFENGARCVSFFGATAYEIYDPVIQLNSVPGYGLYGNTI